MRVTVIGAWGFVGSAFVRHLASRRVDAVQVTRETYARLAGLESDVVIDAAANSRKFLAESAPFEEFDLSVSHRMRTLRDFPAELHVHVSSVDVYSDLTSSATTREETSIDIAKTSHYGFHKRLAEQIVEHHARRWLIVRLAGMVGPGLRKNPVYDILNGCPLRIHPDSQYQFMHTDDMARLVWLLVEKQASREVFNVCGEGLISPREIAAVAGCAVDDSALDAGTLPRVVNVSGEKLNQVARLPDTRETVVTFVNERRVGACERPEGGDFWEGDH